MEINYLAVLVSGLAGWILGALWYSPFLFGKIWMAEMGMTEEGMKGKDPKIAMLFGLITALVTGYVFANLLNMMNAQVLGDGLVLAVWVWLGFTATVNLGAILWEGRSVKLFMVNTSYHLVSLLIMGAILVSWV